MTIRSTFVILAAVAAGACQREAAAPAQSAAQPPATAATATAADAASPLAAFLPPPGTPAGWTRTKPVQAYGPDNLWEFIDGAAETYVSYGFQNALSAGFAHAGADVGLEIYEMADSLHAFGIYAQERPPSVQPVAVGDEAYTNSNVVVFRKGSCYVKLTATRADRPGPAAMTALAGSVAAKIPAGAPLPGALAAFPAKGLVPNSTKFVPKDVLGQRQLSNGFEASYQEGTGVARLVVVPFDSAKDAAGAFARYRAFVAEGGRVRAAPRGGADEAFAGDDKFSGRVFAARAGATMAISLGAQAEATAVSLVGEYLRAAHGQDKR
jgi:hypothetical protein